MSEGTVRLMRDGAVATILFDRPEARNAMTWRMYDQLAEACARVRGDAGIKVAVLRGVGGRAFVAGTDIAQFRDFAGADDGVAYERRIEDYLAALEALPVPTLAAIEGFAVGGGMMIAACCDLRIATPGTRIGVPVARTLGNCLSVANHARLVAVLGAARTKRMMLMADNLDTAEALACGFLMEVVDPAALERRIGEICARLEGHAPLTMRVTKEAVRRLVLADMPEGEDLVRLCYGSRDFHIGVEAFVAKRTPRWSGR